MFTYFYRVKALLYRVSKDLDQSLAESDRLPLCVPWDHVIHICAELMVDLCGSHLRAGVLLDVENRSLTREFKWPLEWRMAVTDTMTAQAQPMDSRENGQLGTTLTNGQARNKRKRSSSDLDLSPTHSKLNRSRQSLPEDKDDNYSTSRDPVMPSRGHKTEDIGGRVLTAVLSEASLSKRFCWHECLVNKCPCYI